MPSRLPTPSNFPSKPRTVDELIRQRRQDDPDRTAVVFPVDKSKYAGYTMRQLDDYAAALAHHYASIMPARQSSDQAPAVIAVLGSPDFTYLVTLLALAKLGHSTLLLSPRLAAEAYKHLLTTTGAQLLLSGPEAKDIVSQLQPSIPTLDMKIVNLNKDAHIPPDTHLTPTLNPDLEHHHPIWILHSSGSTGLPHAVPITHRSALARYSDRLDSFGLATLTTLPLFHAHGLSSFFRSIYAARQIVMYNLAIPITVDRLAPLVQTYQIQLFCSVPFTLKVLAESDGGIELLKSFELVTSGGSPIPKPLGDLLTHKGVRLVSIYGSSEAGTLLTSVRPRNDLLWDWLRPAPGAKLQFKPCGEGLVELIVPPDWTMRVAANLEDGSWATKDLFVRHADLEAYRYAGRLDDVIVLNNGEKANPVSVEGEISKHALVEAAVLFGQGRPALGLALVPSPAARGMGGEQILGEVWEVVDAAQKALPAYCRFTSDMVVVLDRGVVYPRTDKGTVIRQAFYRQFATAIGGVYQSRSDGPRMKIASEAEARGFLATAVARLLPGSIPEDADFFDRGMDSLQATQLVAEVTRSIDLESPIDVGVVFNRSSIALLAAELFRRSQHIEASQGESDEPLAQHLIEKYSANLPTHIRRPSAQTGRGVVLTGATGSLGAHILSQLLADPSITRIWCLVRASSLSSAISRIYSSLSQRHLPPPISAQSAKLTILPSSLSSSSLGLSPPTYSNILQHTTDILHVGWPVNFNRHLRSFEHSALSSLHNLLTLSLQTHSPTPARVHFFSSIGTAMRNPSRFIPESIPEFSHAQGTGYAQSKYVAEQICHRVQSTHGIPVEILRIGQIIGDTEHGIWNASEAPPLLIRSLKAVGCLPALDTEEQWLPVDVVAGVSLDILRSVPISNLGTDGGGAGGGCLVYNVVNPKTLHWTRDLLPILKKAGVEFDIVSPRVWLEKLRNADQDPATNPTIKLLGYFERKVQEEGNAATGGEVSWCSEATAEKSATFASITAPDEALIKKIVDYFDSIWGLRTRTSTQH